MQLLADALGLQGVFATIEGFEHGECGTDEGIIGEDAAEADGAFIRVDGDEGVDAVFRAELIAPAAFGGGSAQTCAADFSDFHG
jgi:hypothetical protein